MKHITLLLISFTVLFSQGQELTETVYFDTDDFLLTPESMEVLENIIPSLQNKNIEIAGFTDSTGNASYNKKLSQKRAQSVADFLLSKGINKENIEPLQSKGETTVASSLSKNRKVVITALFKNESESISEIKPTSETAPKRKDEHLSKTKEGKINQETIDNIKAGDILNVGGLEFHPGRHYLTGYSFPILDKLSKVLLDNPNVKIEIQGHICCQPSGDGLDTDTGTRNLSENRAEMVYVELIKRGVNKDRLTFKGYGSSRKLEEEINAEAMQRNRRVSILILEK